MTIKDDIKRQYKIVLPNDKVIVFRNPKDILFGTMYIERQGNEITVYGRPKKSQGNGNSKIFKIIRNQLVNDGHVSISKLEEEIRKIKEEQEDDEEE